jgi:hypothetical protein
VAVETTGVTVFVTGVSVLVAVETTGATVFVTGVSVWVAVEATGVTVLVTGVSVWVTVEATGAAVLVTDPIAVPAVDVALVTVLLTCAAPPAVCLTAGVLVLTTGESAWAAGLMTGAAVVVTGAVACPAAGNADAADCGVVAELPLPPEDWVPAPEEPLCDPAPCWPAVTAEVTEVTGLAAVLTADPADERAEDGDDPRGDCVSRADACACLENSIMMTKIPAATIASCIARRATRRAIGCGMSSSHSPETGGCGTSAARILRIYATCPRLIYAQNYDMLFGHQRTVPSAGEARGLGITGSPGSGPAP